MRSRPRQQQPKDYFFVITKENIQTPLLFMTEAVPFPNSAILEFRFACQLPTSYAPPVSYITPVSVSEPENASQQEQQEPIIIHAETPAPLPSKWRSAKISSLRGFCQERGLLAEGTKPELIARLEQHSTQPQNSTSVSNEEASINTTAP